MTEDLRDKLLKLGGFEQLFNGGKIPSEKIISEAKALRIEVYQQIIAEGVVDDLSILVGANVVWLTHFQDPASVSFEVETVICDNESFSIQLLNFRGWCDITDPPPQMKNDSGETNRYHREKLPN